MQATSLSDEQIRHWALDVLVMFLMVALLDHGFEATALPGQPVVFKRGEQTVEIGVELGKYLKGELDEETWAALLSDLGILDIEMGSLITGSASTAS